MTSVSYPADSAGWLRMADVTKLTTFHQTHISRMVREGKFPKPVKFGPKVTVFRRRDVERWLEQRWKEQQEAAANGKEPTT